MTEHRLSLDPQSMEEVVLHILVPDNMITTVCLFKSPASLHLPSSSHPAFHPE